MSTSSSTDGGIDGTFRANADADQSPRDDNGSEDPGQIDLDALAAALQIEDWETVNSSVHHIWTHDGKTGLHFYAQVDDGADTDPNRTLARQLILAGLKMLSARLLCPVIPVSIRKPTTTKRWKTQMANHLKISSQNLPRTQNPPVLRKRTTNLKRPQFPVDGYNEEELGHFSHENDPGSAPKYFVPAPQYELPEFACPESGRSYKVTAHPGRCKPDCTEGLHKMQSLRWLPKVREIRTIPGKPVIKDGHRAGSHVPHT